MLTENFIVKFCVNRNLKTHVKRNHVNSRHGLVATIVVRQTFNEDKNLSQQIHEDKRQKDKC